MALRHEGMYSGRIIRVASREFVLKDDAFLGEGRDGEVYQINAKEAVKVYKYPERAAQLRNKVLLLCGKAPEFAASVVTPTAPVWLQEDEGREIFCGFSMKLLHPARNLKEYCWRPGMSETEEKSFDRTIAGFLYDLAEGLRTLHRSRVVVADLKPDNILVAEGQAWLVDFDSCAIQPDYPADNWSNDYLDPLLRTDAGMGPPRGEFTPEGDWWALGVISFQLFMGLCPWDGSHPQMLRPERRVANYSVVGFDPRVRVPKDLLRPLTWFTDKSRLRDWFLRLFSPNVQARHPIDYVLEAHLPRPHDLIRSGWQPSGLKKDGFNQAIMNEIERRAMARRTLPRTAFLNCLLGATS